MIIPAQSSSRGSHDFIFTAAAPEATRNGAIEQQALKGRVWAWAITGDDGENSRTKAQNVVVDSTALNAVEAEDAPQAICLVMDCSGSMAGAKLEEVKAAATRFVADQPDDFPAMAFVRFSNEAETTLPLTKERGAAEISARHLYASGSTAMHRGLEAARQALRTASARRYALLFSDGLPDSTILALIAARQLRQSGVTILAIGTGDADTKLLARVTGDARRVLHAHDGKFHEAFEEARHLMSRASLLDVGRGHALTRELVRCGAWTAFIASGVAVAFMLTRGFAGLRVSLGAELFRLFGCVAASAAAGAIAQLLFVLSRHQTVAMTIDPMLLGGIYCAVLARRNLVDPSRRRVIAFGMFGALYALLLVWAGNWLGAVLPLPAWLLLMFEFTVWYFLGIILAWFVEGTDAPPGSVPIAVYAGWLASALYLLLVITEAYLGEAPFITEGTTRVIGWTVLGSVFGLTMAFLPDLDWRLAGLAGATGGCLAGCCFLVAAAYAESVLVRFIGGALLGLWLGMMFQVALEMQGEILKRLQRLTKGRWGQGNWKREEQIAIHEQQSRWDDEWPRQASRVTRRKCDRLAR